MINYNNAKISLITLLRGLFLGTVGGTRTHMVSRWILNPVRLPIPPQRHKLSSQAFNYYFAQFGLIVTMKIYTSIFIMQIYYHKIQFLSIVKTHLVKIYRPLFLTQLYKYSIIIFNVTFLVIPRYIKFIGNCQGG